MVQWCLKGTFASDQVGLKVKSELKLLALAFVLSAVLQIMICVADNSLHAACTIAAGALIQTFNHCEGLYYFVVLLYRFPVEPFWYDGPFKVCVHWAVCRLENPMLLLVWKNISGWPNNNFHKVCPMMCWINPSLLAFFPGLSGVRFWPQRGHRIDKEGSTPERSPILCLPTVGMSYTAFSRKYKKDLFLYR